MYRTNNLDDLIVWILVYFMISDSTIFKEGNVRLKSLALYKAEAPTNQSKH
jgi:hypothetical protein